MRMWQTVLLWGVAAWAAAPAWALDPTITTQSLGTIPGLVGFPTAAASGTPWAAVVRQPGPDGGYQLLVDGRPAARWTDYDQVGAPSLSPEGLSWAVDAQARGPAPSRFFRIIDGTAYGPFRWAEAVTWGPGRHWSFRTDLEKGRGLVADGKVLGPWDGSSAPAWDPTGKHLAVPFQRAGAWWVSVDGRDSGPFAEARLVTRADGAWIGFVVKDQKNAFTLVAGGQSYGPYEWMDPALDWISPSGDRWLSRVYKKGTAYLLDTGKESRRDSLDFQRLPGGGYCYTWGGFQNWKCDVNGEVFGPLDGPGPVLTRADGTWAFWYGALTPPEGFKSPGLVQIRGQKPVAGDGLRLAADGAFTWTSGGIDSPLVFTRWTPDSRQDKDLYTLAHGPDGWTLTTQGRALGPYAQVGPGPVANAEGTHWGVVVRTAEGGALALVDGIPGPATGPVQAASDLVLSDNGASSSFRTFPVQGSDQQQRITNGQTSGPYAWAGQPAFSADGRHFVNWAQDGAKKNVLVVDGKTYGPYAQGRDRSLFDPESGQFVLGLRDKAGLTAVTPGGTYGPYRDLTPLRLGFERKDGDLGSLLGFAGTLPDGRTQLWIAPGLPGGGKTYGTYRRVDLGANGYCAADGREWIIPVEKEGAQGQWYLRNGTEVKTDGYAVRPLGNGWLMMVRQGNQESLVKDGTTLGSWTKVFSWWVTADGQTWLAEVQEGDGPGSKNLVVVNGRSWAAGGLTRIPGSQGELFRWSGVTEAGEAQIFTLDARSSPRF